MRILACLLKSLPPSPGEDHKTKRILFGGRKTDDDDEAHVQLFSKILLGFKTDCSLSAAKDSALTSEDAAFDTLREELPFKWNKEELYDTVNPFGDSRQIDFQGLWTFDVENDKLLYTDRHHTVWISLECFRNGPVTLANFEFLGPPVFSLSNQIEDPTLPYWKPHILVDGRTRALTDRILCDFNHQWRHILRNSYNTVTLRVFARALILLATLDFDVQEESSSRHGVCGSHIWITDLPKWKPFETNIVRARNVYVVICHSIQKGMSLAHEHAASQDVSSSISEGRPHYMILSVKHVTLCHAGPDGFEHTAPSPLLNGSAKPSGLALDYLLWATAETSPIPIPSLEKLPCESQDNILSYVSMGPVAAARLGCLLSLGSIFLWKDGRLKIALEESYTNRTPWSPVESQLWFQENKVGIAYRGR